MFNRLLLVFIAATPNAAWSICSNKQVGEMTFSDCPAEGHALNNPAGPGVTLQPVPAAAAVSVPLRLVAPHETLDMSGRLSNAKTTISEDAAVAPHSTQTSKAPPKKTHSKETKKSAKRSVKTGTKK